jgi:hypothetical protein
LGRDLSQVGFRAYGDHALVEVVAKPRPPAAVLDDFRLISQIEDAVKQLNRRHRRVVRALEQER